jgi:hypothetical protein
MQSTSFQELSMVQPMRSPYTMDVFMARNLSLIAAQSAWSRFYESVSAAIYGKTLFKMIIYQEAWSCVWLVSAIYSKKFYPSLLYQNYPWLNWGHLIHNSMIKIHSPKTFRRKCRFVKLAPEGFRKWR